MKVLDDLLEKEAEAVRYDDDYCIHIAYDWFHALKENERYVVTVYKKVRGDGGSRWTTYYDRRGAWHWQVKYEEMAADLTTLGTHASLQGFDVVNVNADDWKSTD